jgi:hypothetical protein
VGQELAVEFGQLPPSFLPVGIRRLYEYQLDAIGAAGPIYLTIPESFSPPQEDARRLAELGVTVVHVPEGISLGESIVFALNLIGGQDQPVHLLHGDTLVDDITLDQFDWVGITAGGESYSWAEVDLEGERIVGLETVAAGTSSGRSKPILCGVFAFAHCNALIQNITRARGNFVSGILNYAKQYSLSGVGIRSWYDFGHVHTFFRSRRLVTSARHFNTLLIDGKTARKVSEDHAKVDAEVNWLASIPPPLRIYSARLIDAGRDSSGSAFYETEYDYLPTLSELFVFGALGKPAWEQMLRSCNEFLTECSAAVTQQPSGGMLRSLCADKTIGRLEQFSDATGFNIFEPLIYEGKNMPSLVQIAADAIERIDFASHRLAHVMHGDFCFSNILYDSRVQRIHVIDPRGFIISGQPSIYGDLRYDLAKLAHSIIGRYDQIIAGRYWIGPTNGNRYSLEIEQAPHHPLLEQAISRFEVDGICAGGYEVRAIVVTLFLSMLPLHSDRPDRQRAFVANALRLYAELEELGA